MRILVTGGAGYIGSHTVQALTKAGHQVYVYDNLINGHSKAIQHATLIVGDLLDRDRLDGAFIQHQIEAVIHFAALTYVGVSVTNPGIYYRNNVSGSIELCETMRRHGVNKLVFSSTCATYGIPEKIPIDESNPQRPINPYGQTKLMIEHVMRDYSNAYGWGCVALRYFNAAGASADGQIGEWHQPETHLLPLLMLAALGKQPTVKIFGDDYPTADGTCIRDYIHVDDLAQAHQLAIENLKLNQFEAYNLGNGQGFSVKDAIAAVEKISGKKVPVEFTTRRAGDPPVLIADASHAKANLGWKPRYQSLEEIVATAWAWHSTHPTGYQSN